MKNKNLPSYEKGPLVQNFQKCKRVIDSIEREEQVLTAINYIEVARRGGYITRDEHEMLSYYLAVRADFKLDNKIKRDDFIIEEGQKVYNLETHISYIYEGEVTNATKENPGEKMVLYTNSSGNKFVREKKEFQREFTTDIDKLFEF